MTSWNWIICHLILVAVCTVVQSDVHMCTLDKDLHKLAMDHDTGKIYVGAVNTLYQLSSSLELENSRVIGPEEDDAQCIPPISKTSCPHAKETNNSVKLLLIEKSNNSLIFCGSVFKGICTILDLGNISNTFYVCDTCGENSFVAATDDSMTAGIITTIKSKSSILQVLIVGNGHNDALKLLSIRNLDPSLQTDNFVPVEDTAVLKVSLPNHFYHNFKLTFESDGFIYFVFTRVDEKDNVNKTFILRFCPDDVHFYSYIEMLLECGNDTTQLNVMLSGYVTNPGENLEVLFLLFTNQYKSGSKFDQSALCLYTLKQINQQIEENRLICYSKKGNLNNDPVVYNPYRNSEKFCTSELPEDTNIKHRCGADFLLSPLSILHGVKVKPAISYSDNFTAVAVAVENEHTVAFLGNSKGNIHKVFLNTTVAGDYHTVSVDSTKVNHEIVFDADYTHLYATTKRKVIRLPVQECFKHSNCASCIKSKDPYCGWCVAERKCSRKSECPRANEDNHWLWSYGNGCTSIREMKPPNMSRKEGNERVMLKIDHFPATKDNETIICKFGDSETPAKLLSKDTVTCESPPVIKIPPTSKDQDFVAVQLQLSFKDNEPFTSTEYPFYDCSAIKGLSENTPCISCVSSQWNCEWNTHTFECTENLKENAIRHNEQDRCPRFENPSLSLIPVKFRKHIDFYGVNLDLLDSQYLYVYTNILWWSLIMQEVETILFFQFTYDKSETVPLLFSIKARKGIIDSKLNVTLYNCSYNRKDCSMCLSADNEYKCQWSDEAKMCVYKENVEETKCPPPTINSVDPQNGPLQGGILITIKGVNLGIKSSDVKAVRVAGVPCTHQESLFSVSHRIVCEIGSTDQLSTVGGVRVDINGEIGHSDPTVLFAFRDPEPQSIEPQEGIKAGGTIIKIKGTNLKTGTKKDVKIEVAGIPCEVIDFEEELTCKTGPFNNGNNQRENVVVKYGASTAKQIKNVVFTYSENPKVSEVRPSKSFKSGGRHIFVYGKGFDLIQRPIMLVTPFLRNKRKRRSLEHESFRYLGHDYYWFTEEVRPGRNDTTISFSSPNVSKSAQVLYTYVQLDGFFDDLKFEYVEDPEFMPFTSTIRETKFPVEKNNCVHSYGKNLDSAMSKSEAKAFVRDENWSCSIQTLSSENMYVNCENLTKKLSIREQQSDLPFIVVFGNIRKELGKVKYAVESSPPLNIILPLVIIPLVALIGLSIYCYRRKSQQAEREYEKVKNQLENLEESVRDRCKKEFTDLMIEMEDQTNDVNEVGIPFLDYKSYTDRVFFLPSKEGEKDVMITGKLDIPEGRRQVVEQALNQFSNLLNSKSFLINFIHTLEGQRGFAARSKVYFASLLTVALHGKLEYYTDIMRTLFLELMEQYVAKNPKLMLRRSETVVERMLSNWMSICLYQFLKDSAGEPLYKLFKAVKHQVEKGPVDFVQKKAKYTLNDTGLLGDDVEYVSLTVNVIMQGEDTEPTAVKVLNYDTISQVKEKIIDQVYKSVPYSQRPKVNSMVLEWRPGSTGQILSDVDLTTVKDGRWKRVNTLKHYNVRDGATIILSRVLHLFQQPEDNLQVAQGENTAFLEEENKLWHLVRPTDEVDEGKAKRGSIKEKERTKAITEIYLTRLLSVKGTLQQFVDNFFKSVLSSNQVVPPAVKYFFDFLDEEAAKHGITDEETIHIWKTNSLPLRFWVNILKNPHFIFDVHVNEVVDASLSVIAQMFMDACTRTEHKLSRDSPSNKLLYAKEISAYKKVVEDYYKDVRQMVQVSDQDMNTHLAEISRAHTDKLNTLVALNQLYQYTSKYYDEIINALEEDPAAQKMQLAFRLQQIAAALEKQVTDL
uniref:Plexin B2 n=1 Tax=Latimeria chalumnae TaxID=7897 RepID=H3B608_LATCH